MVTCHLPIMDSRQAPFRHSLFGKAKIMCPNLTIHEWVLPNYKKADSTYGLDRISCTIHKMGIKWCQYMCWVTKSQFHTRNSIFHD